MCVSVCVCTYTTAPFYQYLLFCDRGDRRYSVFNDDS